MIDFILDVMYEFMEIIVFIVSALIKLIVGGLLIIAIVVTFPLWIIPYIVIMKR